MDYLGALPVIKCRSGVIGVTGIVLTMFGLAGVHARDDGGGIGAESGLGLVGLDADAYEGVVEDVAAGLSVAELLAAVAAYRDAALDYASPVLRTPYRVHEVAPLVRLRLQLEFAHLNLRKFGGGGPTGFNKGQRRRWPCSGRGRWPCLLELWT
jgi:hypothetical protein